MSGLFDALFGSKPSVQTTTEPNINSTQSGVLNNLAQLLGSGQPAPGTPNYTGEVGAPVTPATSTSLAGLENLASGVNTNTGASPTASAATSAFTNLLSAPAPTVDPAAATAAFKTGVVDPLTSDFTSYTLPAIAGKYGQSAGGAFGSDALAARQQAGLNLDRTLAASGANYALDTQTANQNAQTSHNNTLLGLLGLAPSISGLPTTLQSGTASLLNQILTGGTVGQAAGQSVDSANTSQFNTQNSQGQNLLSLMLGLSTAPTQGTQSVVNPGNTGILTSLLTGAASGFGKTLGA